MSHKIEPEGFTSAMLAFGAKPGLAIGEYNKAPQEVTDRMDLIASPRREYKGIVAPPRVKRTINHESSNEEIIELHPGDEVLVYRDKKRVGRPLYFLVLWRPSLYRARRERSRGRISIYNAQAISPTEHSHQRPIKPSHPNKSRNSAHIFIVEMDWDENDPRFAESRQREFDGFVAKGEVKANDVSDLPKNANVASNRFILSFKLPGTEVERLIAQWTLQRHLDKNRHKISNDSSLVLRMMYCLVLAVAFPFFNSLIWKRDVDQAYLQTTKFKRDVFTTAPPEAKIEPDR